MSSIDLMNGGRFSRSSASSSVEVNSEAKKMEMADLFQYKVYVVLPPHPTNPHATASPPNQ